MARNRNRSGRTGSARFTTFCKVAAPSLQGPKGFAPPLDVERWTLFAHMLNPHYKLVEDKISRPPRRQWVGRISAQSTRTSRPSARSPAQFGCARRDRRRRGRARADRGRRRLAARAGRDAINGPFSPSINGECGMLVEGFEATPMIFMPWHPPYLSRHLEALGYAKARDLISYRYDISDKDAARDAAHHPTRKEWRDRLKMRHARSQRRSRPRDGADGRASSTTAGATIGASCPSPTTNSFDRRRAQIRHAAGIRHSSSNSTASRRPSSSRCPISFEIVDRPRRQAVALRPAEADFAHAQHKYQGRRIVLLSACARRCKAARPAARSCSP